MRKWTQKREKKSFLHKHRRRDRDWGTKAYNEIVRTGCGIFKFILTKIEQDFTTIELKSGDLKTISPGEQLLLTLRYLATGESHFFILSVSHISKNIIFHSPGGIIKKASGTYLEIPDAPDWWNHIPEKFNLCSFYSVDWRYPDPTRHTYLHKSALKVDAVMEEFRVIQGFEHNWKKIVSRWEY